MEAACLWVCSWRKGRGRRRLVNGGGGNGGSVNGGGGTCFVAGGGCCYRGGIGFAGGDGSSLKEVVVLWYEFQGSGGTSF